MPYKGKVVDADTKEPIQDAVVLAIYYMTTTSIAGSNSYPYDAQEILTNQNGEFNIPAKRVWFDNLHGWPPGSLVIFKSGYGLFPDHKRSEAVGENKSWPPSRKYVVYEIPKISMQERKKQLISFHHDIPYNKRRLYFSKVNEERVNLGYPPFPIPKDQKKK
jgi:hypothetical protein